MSHALTRLYLQANGATMPLRERTTNGNRGHTAPTADLTCCALHDHYNACRTNRARLHVILETQRVATRAAGVDRARVHGTDEWRAAIINDKRSMRSIAADYGIALGAVSQMKKAARESQGVFTDLRSTQVFSTFQDAA